MNNKLTRPMAGFKDIRTWKLWHVPCALLTLPLDHSGDLLPLTHWEKDMVCFGCGQSKFVPKKKQSSVSRARNWVSRFFGS